MNNTDIEFVSKFQYPITAYDRNSNKQMVIGSCVLLNLNKRVFLITAAHVMNVRHSVKDKELWLWNGSNGIKAVLTEDIIGNPELDCEAWSDFAILELSEETCKIFNHEDFYSKRMVHFERLSFDLKNDAMELFTIAGYPSSKNKILNGCNKKPKQTLCTTQQVFSSEEKLPTNIFKFFIEWDPQNVATPGIGLPKPQGMSGGGVWGWSKKSEYNPMLCGIAVEHHKNKKRIVCVKLSLILSTLMRYFLDLELKAKVPWTYLNLNGDVDDLIFLSADPHSKNWRSS